MRARPRCFAQRVEMYDAEFAAHFTDEPSRNALRLRPMVAPLPASEVVLRLVQLYMQAHALQRGSRAGPPLGGERFGELLRLASASALRTLREQNICALGCGVSPPARARWESVMLRLCDCAAAAAAEAVKGDLRRVQYMASVKLLLDITDPRWPFLRGGGASASDGSADAAAADKRDARALQALLLDRAGRRQLYAAAALYVHRHSAAAQQAQQSPQRAAAADPAAAGGGDDVLAAATLKLCARAAQHCPAAARHFAHSILHAPALLRAHPSVTAACTNPQLKGVWASVVAAAAADPPCPSPLPPPPGSWTGCYQVANSILLGRRGAALAACRPDGGVGWLAEATAQWAGALGQLLRGAPQRAELRRFLALPGNEDVERELSALQSPGCVGLLLRDVLLPEDPAAAAAERPADPSPQPPNSPSAGEGELTSPGAALAKRHSSSQSFFKGIRKESELARTQSELAALAAAGQEQEQQEDGAAPAAAPSPETSPPAAPARASPPAAAPGTVHAACQADGPPQPPEWAAPRWLPCCRLLNVLTKGWDPRGAVDALAAQPELVEALWCFLEANMAAATAYAEGDASLSEATAEELGEVMLLWLICYDAFLRVCDDEEFYEIQRPLSLDQSRKAVLLLSTVSFRLGWSASQSLSPLQLHLLMSARSALRKLNARHARRPFADSELWQVPALKKRYGFDFGDVLRYLRSGGHGENPFDAIFGALGDLSQEMRRSNNPVERHVGTFFNDLRELFGDLHRQLGPAPPSACTKDTDLFRCQSVLHPTPFLEPFEDRVEYLRCLVERDRTAHHADDVKLVITIRRASLFEDAFAHFSRIPEKRLLKALLHVNFLNSEGLMEAGIDGGGLFKEFLHQVLKHGFRPETGLFRAAEDNKLYPNPASATEYRPPPEASHLALYRFLGRILAKAVYEGVVVETPLADFFLNTMLGHANTVEDLKGLDGELHRNLLSLKEMDDVSDLSLSFTIHNEKGATELLVPRGDAVDLTNANLQQYITLVADYRLSKQMQQQSEAFTGGFYDILPQRMLALFNRTELSQLICGRSGDFSLGDLRAHTRYEGYQESDAAIAALWSVLESLDVDDRHRFLAFVTSSRRPPLLGFGHLRPPFVVRREEGDGAADERLPSASTCFNLLRLPPYSTEEQLRTKLLYAIRSEAGFELS